MIGNSFTMLYINFSKLHFFRIPDHCITYSISNTSFLKKQNFKVKSQMTNSFNCSLLASRQQIAEWSTTSASLCQPSICQPILARRTGAGYQHQGGIHLICDLTVFFILQPIFFCHQKIACNFFLQSKSLFTGRFLWQYMFFHIENLNCCQKDAYK